MDGTCSNNFMSSSLPPTTQSLGILPRLSFNETDSGEDETRILTTSVCFLSTA